MGCMCSDHFQPGSQIILTMDISPKLTNSIFAFGGVRVSSGASKLFFCDVDMVGNYLSFLTPFRKYNFARRSCKNRRWRPPVSSSGDYVMEEILLPIATAWCFKWNQRREDGLLDGLLTRGADGRHQRTGGTDCFPCRFVVRILKWA